MSYTKMVRVSKRNPCPICGKPDWCLVAPDGSAAICARIETGSVKRCGGAGWLHVLTDNRYKQGRSRRGFRKTQVAIGQPLVKDFRSLADKYQARLTATQLAQLAGRLNVSVKALQRLAIGWNGEAYTFPMRDAQGKVIGIRLRYPSGSKAAVSGSRNGLFIPADLNTDEMLVITEGPTDCAAMLDLEFDAVGRPSCNAGAVILRKLARGRKAVIAGDNDAPGRRGAEALAAELVLCCRSVRIIYPPEGLKDLRQWKVAGLGSATLKRMVATIRPVRLSITSHMREEAL